MAREAALGGEASLRGRRPRLEERHDGVHVVATHLANVLEEEGEGLEHAVLHVELWDAVLVEQPGQHLRAGAQRVPAGPPRGHPSSTPAGTVNGEHVSATMAIATVVQTRFCRSCTLRLLSSVASTSCGPMAFAM